MLVSEILFWTAFGLAVTVAVWAGYMSMLCHIRAYRQIKDSTDDQT